MHCDKNNLNLRIKTEPATAGADATVRTSIYLAFVHRLGFYEEIQITFGTVCGPGFYEEIQITFGTVCGPVVCICCNKMFLISKLW